MAFIISGCASAIVDGEYVRTSSTTYPAKAESAPVDLFFDSKSPDRNAVEIGRVSARAFVLDKGIEEIRKQVIELGGDAATGLAYERKFSADYLQDLYFIDGKAVKYED
jgi:hypothetical protein